MAGRSISAASYPDAEALTVTAGCSDAKSNPVRLYKTECQRLADNTCLHVLGFYSPEALRNGTKSNTGRCRS